MKLSILLLILGSAFSTAAAIWQTVSSNNETLASKTVGLSGSPLGLAKRHEYIICDQCGGDRSTCGCPLLTPEPDSKPKAKPGIHDDPWGTRDPWGKEDPWETKDPWEVDDPWETQDPWGGG